MGSTCGRIGDDLGCGADLGWIWGGSRFGVHLGSIWARLCVHFGPICGLLGVDFGPTSGECVGGRLWVDLRPDWASACERFRVDLGPCCAAQCAPREAQQEADDANRSIESLEKQLMDKDRERERALAVASAKAEAHALASEERLTSRIEELEALVDAAGAKDLGRGGACRPNFWPAPGRNHPQIGPRTPPERPRIDPQLDLKASDSRRVIDPTWTPDRPSAGPERPKVDPRMTPDRPHTTANSAGDRPQIDPRLTPDQPRLLPQVFPSLPQDDPRSTSSQPHIDLKSRPRRPRVYPTSGPCRLRVDPTSTRTQAHIGGDRS